MPMEYTGQVSSEAINGEVKLSLDEDGLTLTALFDAYHIPYARVTAFETRDYAMNIAAEKERFAVTRLGNACEAFYSALYTAYNVKVRKALFIKGEPLFTTRGEYRYTEQGKTAQGAALIEVYEDCVLLLPPDDGARRIPICFLDAMDQEEFELTLRLTSGERYSFIRLGRDTKPFADSLERCLHALRENSLQAARAIDGTLGSSQLSAVAKLMPEGVAVPLGRFYEIAPSFITAVEEKIAASRAADEYRVFKGICDPMRICVGMKSGLAGEDAENILWLIVPGVKPGVAAVELALSEETAATFLYQSFESWEVFWQKLNQAMEAVDFKREVIRLTDDELQKPEYAGYAMAVKRNAALRFMRHHFGGRIIHSSPEQWKRELLTYMGYVKLE